MKTWGFTVPASNVGPGELRTITLFRADGTVLVKCIYDLSVDFVWRATDGAIVGTVLHDGRPLMVPFFKPPKFSPKIPCKVTSDGCNITSERCNAQKGAIDG